MVLVANNWHVKMVVVVMQTVQSRDVSNLPSAGALGIGLGTREHVTWIIYSRLVHLLTYSLACLGFVSFTSIDLNCVDIVIFCPSQCFVSFTLNRTKCTKCTKHNFRRTITVVECLVCVYTFYRRRFWHGDFVEPQMQVQSRSLNHSPLFPPSS